MRIWEIITESSDDNIAGLSLYLMRLKSNRGAKNGEPLEIDIDEFVHLAQDRGIPVSKDSLSVLADRLDIISLSDDGKVIIGDTGDSLMGGGDEETPDMVDIDMDGDVDQEDMESDDAMSADHGEMITKTSADRAETNQKIRDRGVESSAKRAAKKRQ